jgi:tRNA modification GTPase
VVRLLEGLLEARGVRLCSWKDFQKLTVGNGQDAIAATMLPSALTAKTAGILLDQYWGSFKRALQEILDASRRADYEQVERLLAKLVSSAPVGRHLTVPWRVVVAGAPNVGKSSLVNALAGYQRCVVAPSAGTTRDVVRTLIAINGWPVELADTAGLREHAASVEQQGITLARSAALDADLCLWVVDASSEPVWPDLTTRALQMVVNKVDLAPAWDLARASGTMRVSASTGEGLGNLCQAIASALVPEPPRPNAAVPFTTDLCDAVEMAWQHYSCGQLAQSRAMLESLLST